jgi:hypothetical protein
MGGLPFLPGLDGNRRTKPRLAIFSTSQGYSIHELNSVPARTTMEQECRTLTGEELMRDGILLSQEKAGRASIIALEPNAK